QALGPGARVSSLAEALAVLGARRVRNLAFARFARRLLTRGHPVGELLWEQSIGTACGTELVLAAYRAELADAGHLCGLLHNLGDVALSNVYPDADERIASAGIGEGRASSELQPGACRCGGSTLTEELASAWGLPERIARALREPESGAPDVDPIA